jgi:hypothetical protein
MEHPDSVFRAAPYPHTGCRMLHTQYRPDDSQLFNRHSVISGSKPAYGFNYFCGAPYPHAGRCTCTPSIDRTTANCLTGTP